MIGYAVSISSIGITSWRCVSSEDALLPEETFTTEQPAVSMTDAAALLTIDIQAWLDAVASANGYDSIASCISYRGSSVQQWDTDAACATAWRDAVWQACFAWQQSAASSPPATIPTSADVIAQLPQPDAYGWVVHEPGQVTP